MPWKHLSVWFAARHHIVAEPAMPLTLVTLRCVEHVNQEAVAFHANAEFETLVAWAVSGRFILAVATLDRDELTLLCTDPVNAVGRDVVTLPLIAAGLARADLRPVMPLKLTVRQEVLLH